VPASFLGQQPWFTVVAKDQFGNFDLQEFAVKVDQANVAPVITVPYSRQFSSASYRANAQWRDANPFDTLRWSLVQAPAGATIDAERSHITWAPTEFHPQTGFDPNGIFRLDPYCVKPGGRSDLIRLRVFRSYAPTGANWSFPAIGRVSDTNADGRVDAADRLAALVIDDATKTVRGMFLNDGTPAFPSFAIPQPDTSVVPVLANLVGDTQPEVVYVGGTPRTLRAYRLDGSLLWAAATPPGALGGSSGATALAARDLAGDGNIRILAGPNIYGSLGVLVATLGEGGSSGYHRFVDVDGDGTTEIAFRNAVYNRDSSLRWAIPLGVFRDAQISVGDLDGDPQPEFIIHSGLVGNPFAGGQLRGVDGNGAVLWGPLSTDRFSANVTVADLDSDGREDVYLPDSVMAVSSEGRVMYNLPSGRTTAAMATDLNGDGAVELLEYDSNSALVARAGIIGTDFPIMPGAAAIGTSGQSIPPEFIDTNADGTVELVLPSARGIYIVEPARGGWNTGEVAPVQQTAADLYVHSPSETIANGVRTVSVVVGNRGLRPVPAGVLLELRRGSQSADSGLIVARTIGALNAGEALTEQFVVPLDGEPLGQFYARVDPAGTVVDCDRTNGSASAGVFRARVTDSGGLFAEDRFFAFATQLMSAPRISAMQPVSIVEGMQLTYQVRLQETPPGSRYIFEIESGQAGAEIHPQTGLFRWTPPRGSTGRFTFVLRAFNLRYDANRQNLIVDVTPTPNRDPVVTSTPVVAAIRDAVYSYDAEAIDPDGDALTYSLPVAPQGMVIDAGSGVISWTPTQAQSGPQAVTLRVSDGRGGSATQSFTVTVGAGANSPPSITSTPTSVGKAARLFVYSATATPPMPMTPETATSSQLLKVALTHEPVTRC
jgi:hypothetical protein